ncbi:MAG: hypothetical protein V1773_07655 [bacterium]
MISGIDSGKYISESVLKLLSKGIVKSYPPINSVVVLKIIEKVDQFYKLLINGTVYQTKLPIELKEGELLLGKVITSNPLVIGLDNFGHLKVINQQMLIDVIKKIGIKLNQNSIELVGKVITAKKALVKSKIEDLIEIYKSDFNINDVQIALLISLLWNPNYTNKEDMEDEVRIIKTIPFDKLCNEIFKSIIRLNNLNLPPIIYEKIGKAFILDVVDEKIVDIFNNRAKNINKLIIFIDKWCKTNYILKREVAELEYLNERLIKYVLQKETYERFNFYPDFLIIKNHKELDLVLFTFELIKGSSGMDYYKVDIGCGSDLNFKGSVTGYFVNNKFSGKTALTGNITKEMDAYFTSKIETLAKSLNIELNLSLSEGRTNLELNFQLKSDLLNFKA